MISANSESSEGEKSTKQMVDIISPKIEWSCVVSGSVDVIQNSEQVELLFIIYVIHRFVETRRE